MAWLQFVSLLEQHYTNKHLLPFSERTHIGPDDNSTTSWEVSPPVTAPHPSPSLVCFIDPGNGDNGCYSQQWEDQTVEGNRLLLQFVLPSAKLQPITCFSKETLDQSAVSIQKNPPKNNFTLQVSWSKT